ncbi:unnamed protein product, partial [Ixodes persulcatus]
PRVCSYGLLGASGCGKTSLLRCLVGLTKPKAGKILVFGQPLHTMHVPGRGVGYMPQELALYADFTVAENLYFYGKLLGLIEERIFYRITFLCSFFQIMPANRTVKTLSGGQQRRVSLAIALLHEPPFLILDEPTVGLDPVLRDVIWRYFVTLSKDINSTLVVTTHFIEEIEQAALVGIMKNGKVWCEQPPSTLVQTYGPGSLSSVYLKVCKRLEVEGPGGDGPLPPAAPSLAVTLASPPAQLSALESGRRWTRIRALMAKNMIKIMRRLVTIIFQLVVPSCVGVVFCLFVGGEPYDLPLAIVNLEVKSALGKMYGTEFIDELSAVTLRKMNYDNLADAFLAVRTQEAWATIYIRENFSTAIYQRYADKFDVPDNIVQEGTIDVYMDSTDYTIRGTIEREIHRAHNAVLRSVVSNSTGQNVSVQTLKITDPFYDGLSFTFREFMSPGIIVSTLFAMSISLTALLLVAEKEEGLRDRCTVAGVTSVEVIIGHALVQMALAYMQTVFMLIVFVNVFDAPIRGSLLMCFVIPVTMAFCGMNFGM